MALQQRLDSLLLKTVDHSRHVRHGLAGVAATDGSSSWTRGFGVLDPAGTVATADARYPIASVTKLFTAVVTMKLVEAGRLRMDDGMADNRTARGEPVRPSREDAEACVGDCHSGAQ